MHVFSARLKTAGTQSITAKDTVTGTLTGTDGGITVKSAAASKLVVSAPASVRSGVAFSLTVTVKPAYDNVVIGYTGTIHFKKHRQRGDSAGRLHVQGGGQGRAHLHRPGAAEEREAENHDHSTHLTDRSPAAYLRSVL